MVGGYLGSSLGGLAVDLIGFREASNIVVGMEGKRLHMPRAMRAAQSGTAQT